MINVNGISHTKFPREGKYLSKINSFYIFCTVDKSRYDLILTYCIFSFMFDVSIRSTKFLQISNAYTHRYVNAYNACANNDAT